MSSTSERQKAFHSFHSPLLSDTKPLGTISMAELHINKKHFNIEHLIKIADVLEVDISEFFVFDPQL